MKNRIVTVETPTHLTQSIASAMPDDQTNNARYDANAKQILADKQVLARILKETVAELKGFDYDTIEACIEGEPKVSEVPVMAGLTNSSSAKVADKAAQPESHTAKVADKAAQPESHTAKVAGNTVPPESHTAKVANGPGTMQGENQIAETAGDAVQITNLAAEPPDEDVRINGFTDAMTVGMAQKGVSAAGPADDDAQTGNRTTEPAEVLSDDKANVLQTESSIPYEGVVTFDVLFRVHVPQEEPGREFDICMYINVEAQNDSKPGYSLPLRGQFYCAREVSMQLSTEFSAEDYDRAEEGIFYLDLHRPA